MADAAPITPLAAVHPIPRSSAPGEISPVIDLDVSYASPSDSDVPLTIVELSVRHGHAAQMLTFAETELAAAKVRYDAMAPERPAATFWRHGDPFPHPWPACRARKPDGRVFLAYGDEDIKELRAALEPRICMGRAGRGFAWVPDLDGIARKAEILNAYDRWLGEEACVAEMVGWTLANAKVSRARLEAKRIEAAILDAPVRSFADVVAKARWIQARDDLPWSVVVLSDVLSLDELTSGRCDSDAPSVAGAEAA